MTLFPMLIALAPALLALAPQRAEDAAAPVLVVSEEPGYTSWGYAVQIEHYPPLVLRRDGTVVASLHPDLPFTGFRIATGKVPKSVLAKVVKNLREVLPLEPDPSGALIVDAGSFDITARLDDAVLRRRLVLLDLSLQEVLEYHRLETPARARAERRLRFARLVRLLSGYAREPYVPRRATMVVQPIDRRIPGYEDLRGTPWPLPELSLADLAERSKPKAGTLPAQIPIEGSEVIGRLAREVISGRLYRDGGNDYQVIWLPDLEDVLR